ncbi:MAG: PAS domain S-box protein, partial [Bacteroidetes bacterium]|nr:PAS domain S-box protein [Bacteroidota bacterium]
MRFSIYIAVIIVFFLLLKTGQSQIYPVQHYSTENGLATRGVYDITQDKNGRMWFSTGVGISTYDGYSWTNYGEEQGVPKHRYSRIFCDDEGVIWAAPVTTLDEVIYYSKGKWEKLPLLPKSILTECEISGLGVVRKNGFPAVYLSTYQGVYIYSEKGWERVGLNEGLADELIYSSALDGTKFYLATRKGISIIENGIIDNSLNAKIPSNFGTVLKIAADKNTGSNTEKLWMLSKDRIGYLERDSFVTVNSGFSLSLKSVLDFFFLTVCPHGEVYFGNVWTRYTLNSQSGGYVLLTEENGFAAEGNTSAFRDREDNVWFSDYKGIDKINTLAFRNHTALNGLGENDVSAIVELGPQSYAFGHNAGITIFSKYHYRYIPFENLPGYVINGSRVLDFHKDKTGTVWFAASKMGAGTVDAEGNIEWFRPPDGVFINSVKENSKGDLIFASSEGLYKLKNGRFETFDYNGIGKIQVRRLFDLGGNFLWAATTSGFFRISDSEVKCIKTSGSISEKSAFAVYKDRDGTIYAGTEKGLFEIVNDSLVTFRRNGFEINDAVFAITKDTVNGYLWFGTGANLIRWNGSDRIKKFNSLNGLVKGEISRAGLLFDSRNTLWIGTDAGLSRYIPALDYENENIPVPEIISAEDLTGNKYSPAEEISTGNGNASLKFSVRGISFVSEKLMEYRIKLDGFDKDWILINQEDADNIVYKNLQPGDYKFRMSVRNYSGIWSEEISSGDIKIKSAFYKRWWFVLLVIAAVIFNILYFYNRYMKRKYTRYLENKVRQRTSELEVSQSELKQTLASLEEKVEERTRELAESENKLRSVIEQASDGIAIYEIESRRLILVNPAYADMLGYTDKEMLNMTIYDVVAHEKESIDHYIENVVRDDKILIKERHHRRKDGSLLPVEVSISMIFYHDIEAMCVIIRDITERRKIQHALHESEKKFREIVELLPEAVFETDVSGNITFVNRQGLDLFGYSEDDKIIGRSIIESIAPEETERAAGLMMEVLRGKIHAGTNFTGIKKDGTRIPIYINKAPIIDGG